MVSSLVSRSLVTRRKEGFTGRVCLCLSRPDTANTLAVRTLVLEHCVPSTEIHAGVQVWIQKRMVERHGGIVVVATAERIARRPVGVVHAGRYEVVVEIRWIEHCDVFTVALVDCNRRRRYGCHDGEEGSDRPKNQ